MQPGGNFPPGAQAVMDGGLPVFRAGFEPVLRVVLQFSAAAWPCAGEPGGLGVVNTHSSSATPESPQAELKFLREDPGCEASIDTGVL
jgi:hypothetical protein